MSVNKDIVTSSVVTATSQHKRDYSEKIRRLYPDLTKILALVKGSNLDNFGKVAYSKGMIDKKPAKRLDFEWATYTAVDQFYTAVSGVNATSFDVADNTPFAADDVVINTNTGSVAVVTSINANATTVAVTIVTGGTAWTAALGDVIVQLLPTYEEGSSRYGSRVKELDTNKSWLHIGREAISIAETVMKTPQYTDEGMLERYQTDEMIQYLRKLEADFLFSKQGTSGLTSVSIGGTSYTVYSMQGVMSYAGAAFDMEGGFNWETFNTKLYPIMPATMHADETTYMLCGRKLAGAMNMWANNKYLDVSETSDVTVGKKAKRFIMGGGLEVELLVHTLFDNTAFANEAWFFQSSDLVYRFMEGLDVKIVENIQLPSTMGITNEIRSCVGLQSWSNGASIKRIKNCLPTA